MYKIIIVDDEKWIRKGIISKLKKIGIDFDTIEESSNGNECIQKAISIKPDIVICDIKMGDLNGLELCQILKNMIPHIKIIIVSGYNEFNYAKKALQIGVVDYLLKPIDTYDLYKSLQKCIECIQIEKQELLNLENKSMFDKINYTREKILDYLQNGYLDPTDVFPDYSEKTSQFKCVYIYINNFISVNIYRYVMNALKYYQDLEFPKNVIFFENKQNEYIILYMLKDITETNKMLDIIDKVNLYIINLLSDISDISIYDYTFEVSEVNKNIKECISQAFYAMKHRIMIDYKNIITFLDTKRYNNVYRIQPKNIIKFALQIEQFNEVESLLREIYNDIKDNYISYSSLQNLYSRFIMILNEDLDFDIETKMMFYPREIYHFNSIKQMLDFIKDIFLNIASLNGESSKDYKRELVLKVKDYIEENYADEITLEKLSSIHHISSCYLSVLFKEVMHMNFQDYVINIRIQNAKKLLKSNKYKIKDVALLTGFNNQHYFSRMFKKITQMTPSEYKDREC